MVIESTWLQVNKYWVHSSLSCLVAFGIRIVGENPWGILQLSLEFELLERIFGIFWVPLRVKDGGKSSNNFSLLSPLSLYDKILIKMLNKS